MIKFMVQFFTHKGYDLLRCVWSFMFQPPDPHGINANTRNTRPPLRPAW